jgi:hypothetical protein
MRTRHALALSLALLNIAPALAADCDADLAEADALVHAVRLRNPELDRRHAANDVAGTCSILKDNYRDMTKARDIMDRCMTGFERRENVGQMDVSLDDIHTVIGSYCKATP